METLALPKELTMGLGMGVAAEDGDEAEDIEAEVGRMEGEEDHDVQFYCIAAKAAIGAVESGTRGSRPLPPPGRGSPHLIGASA